MSEEERDPRQVTLFEMLLEEADCIALELDKLEKYQTDLDADNSPDVEKSHEWADRLRRDLEDGVVEGWIGVGDSRRLVPARADCMECGGMGHTVGFEGNRQTRHPCESCWDGEADRAP